MVQFKSTIARHRDVLNGLHARVYETFARRHRSQLHLTEWKDACAEFHRYSSDVDKLLDQCDAKELNLNPTLREFVFDYISVDPIYFGSGYAKEWLLRQVKRLKLTEPEKEILRQTIMRRVQRGALREFRRFCRIIPKITTQEFISELEAASRSKDAAIRHRALFALTYVQSHAATSE